MKHPKKRNSWPLTVLVILSPIFALALGVGFTVVIKIQESDYSNLVINLFYLVGCIIPVRFLKFTKKDLGLKLIDRRIKRHVLISLAVFILYILFYIFVIRISALKPFSNSTLWGLVTMAVVVLAEEIYFRGLIYGFVEKRSSSLAALIVSAIFFGLIHATQGLSGIITKTFAGWLWGSVRYSSGMIFLVIFPIHYFYNVTWLLFEGNWNNFPSWAIYALPILEFSLGLVIVFLKNLDTVFRKNNN